LRVRVVVGLLVCLALLPITADASARTKNGRFWLRCAPSHRLADDPIRYPGQPGASHLHDFFGNRTTNAASTYSSALGQATTCALPADTAGYWVPTLLADGSPVGVRWFNVYYWGIRGGTASFPPDFRVVAGATAGVASGTRTAAKKTGWMCVKGGEVFAAPPDCGTEPLRMIVTFPSCWDGVSTDSADHHSHVVYPTARICPPDHPVTVPRVVVHVFYDITDGTTATLSSDVMAGAPPGSTVHADFWNTWDQPTLEGLVDRCIDTGPNCAFTGS
jgi:hypothetical protein